MLKKLLLSLFIGLLIFPIGTAFAGGSSMLWKVDGSQFSTTSGALIKSVFALNMQTYFSSAVQIEDLRLSNFAVSCAGSDIVSRFDLRQGDSKIGRGYFVKTGGLFTATLSNKDFILKNNSTYDFSVDLKMKNKALSPAVAHCAVTNISLFDIKNNDFLYSNADTDGYVFVEQNEASMITMGSKDEWKKIKVPFQMSWEQVTYYGSHYIGDGYIHAKILRKGDSNKYEDTSAYVINIYKFDKNFVNVSDLYEPGTKKTPVKFYLKIDDADAKTLIKHGGIVTIKVRDLYLISADNGSYPWGYLTYVKN